MRIDTKLEKKIKTRLQMSRCSGDRDYFRLTIEDEASSCVILEIELDALSIADLLSTRTTNAQTSRYFANPNIGKTHECIRYSVDLSFLSPILEHPYNEKEIKRDMKHIYALAEDRNPGWTADKDSYNSKMNRGGTYEVILRRYVYQE